MKVLPLILVLLIGCGPTTNGNTNADAGGNVNSDGNVNGDSNENLNSNSDTNTNLNGDGSALHHEIRIGFGDPFEPVGEGGEFLVTRGFQGLMDAFPTFRLFNFPPDDTVRLTLTLTLLDVELGGPIVNFMAELDFMEIGSGVNEHRQSLIVNASPNVALDERARLTVTAESTTDPSIRASLDRTVIITEPTIE